MSVVESLDDAVVVTDGGRVVVAWNAAMERLTACARATALNASVDDVFKTLPSAAWTRPLALALAGDRGHGPAVAVETIDGARLWVEPQWAPRADAPGAVLVLRDVTEARKHTHFMRALETVGRSLTSSLDIDQVLDTIAEKTREVMGADAAMVASWDGRAETLTVLRAAGRLTAEYAPGGIPLAGGPMSVAVREGHVVATDDILSDTRWTLDAVRRRHIAREGFKAVAVAPLLVKGVVHGALAVQHWTARSFTDDELALLLLLAEQAALALENARLYAETRGRADRLRELGHLEQMVAASLEPDAVLRAIADAAARLVGADIVQVWTADAGARMLRLRASSGPEAANLPGVPSVIRFGDGITGRTAVEKVSIYVDDVTREPGALSAEWARQSGIERLLAVPMLSGEELLGVVTVRARSGASLGTGEDRTLITTFAAQAAVAVQNAAAYAAALARATRLQALASVTRSITASLNVTDVIRRIVDAGAAMRPEALAALHVIDAERGVMDHTSSVEVRALPREHAIDAGLPGLVAEARQPVLVTAPLEHPRTLVPAWWSERPHASYYGVPVMVGDTLVGVLDYIVEGVPDREEQEALNLLAAHAGIAIRNASLYQAEQVQGARIRALAAVNQRISSTLELDELLRLIAENAAQLTGARFASFWLADDAARTLTFMSHSDPEMGRSFPRKLVSYDEGTVGWIAQHKAPLVIDDVSRDPRALAPDWWRSSGLSTFAGFPVVADGELLAILSLCHTGPMQIAAATQDVIDMFLAQGAIAVRNARLYREAARRRDVAEALARLGRGLAATFDVSRIADLVVSGTMELFGARGAAVYRYDAADDTLRTIVSQGPAGMTGRALSVRRGEGIVGRAVSEGRIVTTEDVLNDPQVPMPKALRDEIERLGHRVAVGVPLLGTHGPVGSLVVRFESGRQLGAEETQALQAFADQAALALENARLYTESQRERREATALADTARNLAVSLDIDEVGMRIVDAVVPVFEALTATLYRIGAAGDLAAVASAGAARAKFDRGLVWPKGTGVVGRCVEARRAVWTRDFMADSTFECPPALRDAVLALGSRAVLATPLNVKSQVVGVLVISYGEVRDFEEREVALLQAFADQAALALENAQLYASARDNLVRLRDTQAQLVQAAKLGALGQLVSGVAHELNNPLSVIIGYGQLLLSRELPQNLRRPVDLMVSQGDRMAKIVRNLLYFARQRPPERALVQISDVIEQTLTLRLNQLSLSNVAVRRAYTETLPAISADSHQLQQVFLNLLLNAEQAILSAGRGGEIVVRTAMGPDADTLVAQVEDNGPGIAAEDLARVFEPFYTTKEVGQGTGLGLSVSYGIVQEHGGRLAVESRPGATIFTVELPVRSAPPRSAVSTASTLPATGNGRPALVVEDEPAVLDLIVQLLTESGWSVDVASGGKPGLERVSGRRYDLIVSDVRMPDGAGDDFYRKAVALDASLAQRFLFITGDTANPAAWRFLQDAKVAVLEKPFDAGTFLEAVRDITTLTG